jgi:hypothetical protein
MDPSKEEKREEKNEDTDSKNEIPLVPDDLSVAEEDQETDLPPAMPPKV